MLYWLGNKSVLMLRLFFFVGMLGMLPFLIFISTNGGAVLSTAFFVCLAMLGITLIVRLLSRLAMRRMPASLKSIPWSDLGKDQFKSIDFSARIAFVSQLCGLLAAASGFGWALVSMLFVIFRGIV